MLVPHNLHVVLMYILSKLERKKKQPLRECNGAVRVLCQCSVFIVCYLLIRESSTFHLTMEDERVDQGGGGGRVDAWVSNDNGEKG